MIEGLRIERVRLTSKESGFKRPTLKPVGRTVAPEGLEEGPTDGDLLQIQAATDGIGSLRFNTPCPKYDYPEEADQQSAEISFLDLESRSYYSVEELALIDHFKSQGRSIEEQIDLPAGITQRKAEVLRKSILRKEEIARIEREEDEIKNQMRKTVEKSDSEVISARKVRRNCYLALDDAFRKAKREEQKQNRKPKVKKPKKQKTLKAPKPDNPYTLAKVARMVNRSKQRIHQIKKEFNFGSRLTAEQVEVIIAFIQSIESAQEDRVA